MESDENEIMAMPWENEAPPVPLDTLHEDHYNPRTDIISRNIERLWPLWSSIHEKYYLIYKAKDGEYIIGEYRYFPRHEKIKYIAYFPTDIRLMDNNATFIQKFAERDPKLKFEFSVNYYFIALQNYINQKLSECNFGENIEVELEETTNVIEVHYAIFLIHNMNLQKKNEGFIMGMMDLLND